MKSDARWLFFYIIILKRSVTQKRLRTYVVHGIITAVLPTSEVNDIFLDAHNMCIPKSTYICIHMYVYL